MGSNPILSAKVKAWCENAMPFSLFGASCFRRRPMVPQWSAAAWPASRHSVRHVSAVPSAVGPRKSSSIAWNLKTISVSSRSRLSICRSCLSIRPPSIRLHPGNAEEEAERRLFSEQCGQRHPDYGGRQSTVLIATLNITIECSSPFVARQHRSQRLHHFGRHCDEISMECSC